MIEIWGYWGILIEVFEIFDILEKYGIMNNFVDFWKFSVILF